MKRRWIDQLEPWKINVGGAAALAAVGLLAYLAGVRPLLAGAADAAALRVTIATQLREAERLERLESDLRSRVNRIRSELEANALTLQTAAFRNERLARLTELAADHDLAVDGMVTSDVRRDERYDMVPIRIEGTGAFPDCVHFLHDLSERFRDTGVGAFEIRGAPGRRPADAFFRFEMIWYAAPSLASAGGGGS